MSATIKIELERHHDEDTGKGHVWQRSDVITTYL